MWVDVNAIPLGGYNRSFYESLPHVKLNEDTGLYDVWAEDGGPTNVSEFGMYAIFINSINQGIENGRPAYNSRAVIPLLDKGSTSPMITTLSGYYGNYNVEYVRYTVFDTTEIRIRGVNTFAYCRGLKIIRGVLVQDTGSDFFSQCKKLTDVTIRIYNNITFKDNPLLSLESIQYMINTARNKESITITLHPDAYARVTQAMKDAASAKQISIASA